MPRKPKLMFQICQSESRGFVRTGVVGDPIVDRPRLTAGSRACEQTDQSVNLGVREDLVEQSPHRTLPVGAYRRGRTGQVDALVFEPEILEPGDDEWTRRPAEPLEQIGQQRARVARAVEALREGLAGLGALLPDVRGCLLGQEAVPHPLADIVPGEPSRERRRVVRADERHVAAGWPIDAARYR